MWVGSSAPGRASCTTAAAFLWIPVLISRQVTGSAENGRSMMQSKGEYNINLRLQDLRVSICTMKKTRHHPRRVTAELERTGMGIRTARIRRRMTQGELATRAGTTIPTISKIERGSPGTSIGLYMKVLWILGLLKEFEAIADPARDEQGLILEAARAPKRVRPKSASNDF